MNKLDRKNLIEILDDRAKNLYKEVEHILCKLKTLEMVIDNLKKGV